MGSLLFGYTDAMNLRGGGDSVHALLLFVAVILLGIAGWQVVRARTLSGEVAAAGDLGRKAIRNRYLAAIISVVASALLLLWFAFSSEVPGELVSFTPHLTTLLVLALASQRLRMPAADGLIYRKGEAR
jgi:simple sugar transport system permease protein